MRVEEIPQDDSILEGHQRACYARDAGGRYVVATSRGWEVEKLANQLAVESVNAVIEQALQDVRARRVSPLAYHMARCHMDVRMLAATSGVWSLRVRRHLRPAVFARLSDAILARYASALGVSPEQLRTIPD